MNNLWKDIMNRVFLVLYHGAEPDEGKTWTTQYSYETRHIISDIKDFHKSMKNAGHEISNQSMADFLIREEYEVIGNTLLVRQETVDMEALLLEAAWINTILSK